MYSEIKSNDNMNIGIFGIGLTGAKKKAFKSLVECLEQEGLAFHYHPDIHKPFKNSRSKLLPPEEYDYLRKSDFVITMGGDGTILQAIAQIGEAKTPILGINLGRLGFLASNMS